MDDQVPPCLAIYARTPKGEHSIRVVSTEESEDKEAIQWEQSEHESTKSDVPKLKTKSEQSSAEKQDTSEK